VHKTGEAKLYPARPAAHRAKSIYEVTRRDVVEMLDGD